MKPKLSISLSNLESIVEPNSTDVFNLGQSLDINSISLVYQGENTKQKDLKIAAMLLEFSRTP